MKCVKCKIRNQLNNSDFCIRCRPYEKPKKGITPATSRERAFHNLINKKQRTIEDLTSFVTELKAIENDLKEKHDQMQIKYEEQLNAQKNYYEAKIDNTRREEDKTYVDNAHKLIDEKIKRLEELEKTIDVKKKTSKQRSTISKPATNTVSLAEQNGIKNREKVKALREKRLQRSLSLKKTKSPSESSKK